MDGEGKQWRLEVEFLTLQHPAQILGGAQTGTLVYRVGIRRHSVNVRDDKRHGPKL